MIAAAAEDGAAVPAVPARDTVKRVDLDRQIVRRDDCRARRSGSRRRRRDFAGACFEDALAAAARGVDATDEAMLAERAGHAVRVVPGDERNVKITTPDDLASSRARACPGSPRVGTGYDLHRLVEGRPLVLAGVTLPFERGPLGHSDGDVVCHALTDAILGAAGAGRHRPAFSQHRSALEGRAGARSARPRRRDRPRPRAGASSSVDVTIILERPKLAPHSPRFASDWRTRSA